MPVRTAIGKRPVADRPALVSVDFANQQADYANWYPYIGDDRPVVKSGTY